MNLYQKLFKRCSHMQTHRWISGDIKCENSPGIHTYHMCDCDRQNTRKGRCSLCLEELLPIAIINYVFAIKDKKTGMYVPKDYILFGRHSNYCENPILEQPENARIFTNKTAKKWTTRLNNCDKANKYNFVVQKLALLPVFDEE